MKALYAAFHARQNLLFLWNAKSFEIRDQLGHSGTKKCDIKGLWSWAELLKKLKLYAQKSSSRNSKKLFHLEFFFFLKIFQFLSWLFGHIEEQLGFTR